MKLIFGSVMGTLLALNSSAALSAEWNCRNYDVEISCAKEKCSVSENFTPLDAYFDDNGNMSILVYTGVYEGKGTVLKDENYMIVVGDDLVFSTSPDSKEDILIAIDTKDKVAVFKGAGFAMPMRCQKVKQEE